MPRAAGRTRPWSGSPPRRMLSSGSRGRSATCPKNSQKLTFSDQTQPGERTVLSKHSPTKSTAAGIGTDQWLKHPFGLAGGQNWIYKLAGNKQMKNVLTIK